MNGVRTLENPMRCMKPLHLATVEINIIEWNEKIILYRKIQSNQFKKTGGYAD